MRLTSKSATPDTFTKSVVISTGLMTTLLVKVSGVALLEVNLKKTKPQYRDYIERTNAFLPWFPKPAVSGQSSQEPVTEGN